MTQLDYLKALIANDALIQDANDSMFKRQKPREIYKPRNVAFDIFQYKNTIIDKLNRIAQNPDEVYNYFYSTNQLQDYLSYADRFQIFIGNKYNLPTDYIKREWDRFVFEMTKVPAHIKGTTPEIINEYQKKLQRDAVENEETMNRLNVEQETASELKNHIRALTNDLLQALARKEELEREQAMATSAVEFKIIEEEIKTYNYVIKNLTAEREAFMEEEKLYRKDLEGEQNRSYKHGILSMVAKDKKATKASIAKKKYEDEKRQKDLTKVQAAIRSKNEQNRSREMMENKYLSGFMPEY